MPEPGWPARDRLARNFQPIAEEVVEGKPELPAGFEQAQHRVPRHPPIEAHGTAGDLALGDEGAQVVLRCIGVQWNLGMLQHLEELVLASMQRLR